MEPGPPQGRNLLFTGLIRSVLTHLQEWEGTAPWVSHPLWGGSARQSSFFVLSRVLPLPVPALALLGVVGALGMSVTSSPGRPAKTWAPKETPL